LREETFKLVFKSRKTPLVNKEGKRGRRI